MQFHQFEPLEEPVSAYKGMPGAFASQGIWGVSFSQVQVGFSSDCRAIGALSAITIRGELACASWSCAPLATVRRPL
jgi:hypothetical protein